MRSGSHRLGLIANIIVALFAYVGCYFLFMVRFLPVVDNGVVRFKSTFRWAPPAPRSGPYYDSEGKATIFNYIFYPADAVYYSVRRFDPKPRQ